MRSAAFALALVACVVAQVACTTDNTPCVSDCPALGGAWDIAFPDGGTPDPDADDCQALGVSLAPGTLEVVQRGAELDGTFEGEPLQGLLYETYEFSLLSRGDGGPDATSVRGRYLATGAPDAGLGQLQGTWTRTVRGAPNGGATQTCTLQRPFTASRQ